MQCHQLFASGMHIIWDLLISTKMTEKKCQNWATHQDFISETNFIHLNTIFCYKSHDHFSLARTRTPEGCYLAAEISSWSCSTTCAICWKQRILAACTGSTELAAVFACHRPPLTMSLFRFFWLFSILSKFNARGAFLKIEILSLERKQLQKTGTNCPCMPQLQAKRLFSEVKSIIRPGKSILCTVLAMNCSSNKGSPSQPWAPLLEQNPVISFLAVLCLRCLQLTMSTPASTPHTAALPSIEQWLVQIPFVLLHSSSPAVCLWEYAEHDFYWRNCVGLVYSWIEPVPEIKVVLSPGFGSPVSDPLSCTSSSGR